MEKKIAKALLSIHAVFLRPDDPFTWASGIKSPIYCDNRLTLTAPEVRTEVENGLPAIGVLYGYGGREELENAGADYLAADLHELKQLLLQE